MGGVGRKLPLPRPPSKVVTWSPSPSLAPPGASYADRTSCHSDSTQGEEVLTPPADS